MDDITITNHENTPVRTALSVTHTRVAYYSDIVEYMITAAVDRFVRKYNKRPTTQQIDFLRREIVRAAVIGHNVERAQSIDIPEHNILNEHDPLHSRLQQLGHSIQSHSI